MARYAVAVTKASGAAAGWVASLRCPAAAAAELVEVHVFAESAAAGAVELRRVTTAGAGAATTVAPAAEDAGSVAATVLLDTAYATTAPVGAGVALRRYALPATIGQGIIWQFPLGLNVPASAALGVFQTSAVAVTYAVTLVFEQY